MHLLSYPYFPSFDVDVLKLSSQYFPNHVHWANRIHNGYKMYVTVFYSGYTVYAEFKQDIHLKSFTRKRERVDGKRER